MGTAKIKVLTFIGMAGLALTIVPIKNFVSPPPQKNPPFWNYNLDFALPGLSQLVYPWGVSLNSGQAIVGQQDWLYLGDFYEGAVTARRRGTTAADQATAQQISQAQQAWEIWMRQRGVRVFRVMVGPDKESIYPEFLPGWAKPSASSRTDTLIAAVGKGIYLDLRPALEKAKAQLSQLLYYKTDTHWNSLAGWIAVRTLTQELSRTEPGQWLVDQDVQVAQIAPRPVNDLSGFLHLNYTLISEEVRLHVQHPVEVNQYDFATGQMILAGGNPMIDAPDRPLLVKSHPALNRRKVLWLRDSFGNAISSLMATTFSETLQIHYNKVTPERLAQLVEAYQPDYVLMTVVERASYNENFQNPPPALPDPLASRESSLAGRQWPGDPLIKLPMLIRSASINMLMVAGTNKITGPDPYLVFKLAHPVLTRTAANLAFDLNCQGQKEPVQMKLFWQPVGAPGFDERNSLRFTASPEHTVVDLLSTPQWLAADEIMALRLDIDSPQRCAAFKLSPPVLNSPHSAG